MRSEYGVTPCPERANGLRDRKVPVLILFTIFRSNRVDVADHASGSREVTSSPGSCVNRGASLRR